MPGFNCHNFTYDAHASQRFEKQLGVYGDGLSGVESQGVVRIVDAPQETRTANREDGIPKFPQRDHSGAGANNPPGTKADIPRPQL